MAKRSSQSKKLKRLRKALYRQPLPAKIDLVNWLKTRSYADSTRQAVELLKDGKVKVDSHVVGRTRQAVQRPLTAFETLRGDTAPEPELQWVASPIVPASYRDRLVVEK